MLVDNNLFETGGELPKLPTPRATDGTKGGPNQRGSSGDRMLPSAVVELLPTPTVGNATGTNLTRSGERQGEMLLPGVAVAAANGALLPTPEAKSSTAGPDYARASRPGSGGDDLVTTVCKATRGDMDWGKYETAVRGWEDVTRPAPYPVEPNSKGKPRLAAAFSEWMMGWPEGWVTDFVDPVPTRRKRPEGMISRNHALKIIGNGVVTQQAEAALRDLLADLTANDN